MASYPSARFLKEPFRHPISLEFQVDAAVEEDHREFDLPVADNGKPQHSRRPSAMRQALTGAAIRLLSGCVS